MKILTAAEMREADRLTTELSGVPSRALMESAGSSVAEYVREQFPDFAQREILVLCGKGNNGGDGLVAARHLLKKGAKPLVCLFANPREMKGDAAANLRRWKQAGGQVVLAKDSSALDRAKFGAPGGPIVVDALLGTGVRGPVEGALQRVIERVNAHASRGAVVAVDVPSGLQADSGETGGAAILADATITFTAPKPGFFFSAGPRHAGRLVVRGIGSPPDLIEEIGKGRLRWSESREFLRFAQPRRAGGHKGDYGHALIIAGSVGKTGAAVLASWAALRAGAGLVTVATPEPALPLVAVHTPEVMSEPLAATKAGTISERSLEGDLLSRLLAGKRALAIGPGLSTNSETQTFIRGAVDLQGTAPIILDADGLNAYAGRAAELKRAGRFLAITPHPGEMARLLGCSSEEVQRRRVELALQTAAEWEAWVVLKGYQTVVAAPDGSAYINSTGNPGMASGGTGDALTGMLAGITAQFWTEGWGRLLAFGVFLHGLAGDIAWSEAGEAPLMASDLIHAIPAAYRRFYSECGRG